ncbi:MAG: hypothetical protein K1Y02_16595 [Candidatus Hydrogenedentes bacterium]|nr:hypothetical protein [Candidatus Hydrogenedentota bacterium]
MKEVKREDFDKDEVLRDAITYRIRAIGEAASKIPRVKSRFPRVM